MLWILQVYWAETNFFQEVRNKMKTTFILLMGCLFSLAIWAEEGPVIIKQPEALAQSEAEPKVVILNNQQVDQKSAHDQKAQVSNQPVVRVMGTPVSVTYAAELKKSRQDAEIQTEQKIVEKLESSRLKDEQERLNKLFGSKTSTFVASKTVAVAPESHAIQATAVSAISPSTEEKIYAGVQVGQSSNFTNVKNLNSYGSFGASAGVISKAGLILESSFFFSQHRLDHSQDYNNNLDNLSVSNTTDLYQISGMLALKYTPSSSRFKPYVGAFVAYNYWMYQAGSNYHCDHYPSIKSCNDHYTKADAVDIGPVVGIDFLLNNKVSLGFNMMVSVQNLYNNRSDKYEVHNYNYYHYNHYDHYDSEKYIKMEETHWLIASLNAKLYF